MVCSDSTPRADGREGLRGGVGSDFHAKQLSLVGRIPTEILISKLVFFRRTIHIYHLHYHN
jgi:hypothetical protein